MSEATFPSSRQHVVRELFIRDCDVFSMASTKSRTFRESVPLPQHFGLSEAHHTHRSLPQRMQWSESQSGHLRLPSTCSASFSRTSGREATKVYSGQGAVIVMQSSPHSIALPLGGSNQARVLQTGIETLDALGHFALYNRVPMRGVADL
jgi:hypothetical protein